MTTVAAIGEIHRRFCEQLPEDLLWVDVESENGPTQRLRVVPGEWRPGLVKVGRHVAISAGAVPRFLEHFEAVYGALGPSETILATAAAHHRLLWIHPFLDGNGRVVRLISHAMLAETLNTAALWSVARGLARRAAEYKRLLANCDLPRRKDLDGRGPLSEEALAAFTRFFLEVCVDQVDFMEQLMEPAGLRARIRVWTEEEIRLNRLPAGAGLLLEALLYRGQLAREELTNILNVGERQARRISAALLERGVLTSASPRAPLRLAFPATLAGRWMPNLFPELGAAA